jgi:hypothetical protein
MELGGGGGGGGGGRGAPPGGGPRVHGTPSTAPSPLTPPPPLAQDPFRVWVHNYDLSLQRGLTPRQWAGRVIFGVDNSTCTVLAGMGIQGCVVDPIVDNWAGAPYGPSPWDTHRFDNVNAK